MPLEIEQEFGRLRDLPCWDVHWDCDTGLRLNFGQPHLDVREPKGELKGDKFDSMRRYRSVLVVGDWRMWVDGHWKLTLPDIPPVRSSSSLRQIEMGLARLDGQKLSTVEITPETGFSRFVFDLGGVLEARRLDRGGDDDVWMLYTPDDRTLMVRGDGMYASIRSSDSQADPVWRPLGRV